jgi:hypothetical protein
MGKRGQTPFTANKIRRAGNCDLMAIPLEGDRKLQGSSRHHSTIASRSLLQGNEEAESGSTQCSLAISKG